MERIVKITENFFIAIDDTPVETDICLRYVDGIPYIMKYDKGIEAKQYNITHSTLPLEEEVVNVTPDGQDYIKDYVFDKIKKLDVLEMLSDNWTKEYAYAGNSKEIAKESFIAGFNACKKFESIKNKWYDK